MIYKFLYIISAITESVGYLKTTPTKTKALENRIKLAELCPDMTETFKLEFSIPTSTVFPLDS